MPNVRKNSAKKCRATYLNVKLACDNRAVCHTLWKTLSSVRSEKNTIIKNNQRELRKMTCIAMIVGGSAMPEVIATEFSVFCVRCGIMSSVTAVVSSGSVM
jgi:hypothetical protein